jgi:hypothetical protein
VATPSFRESLQSTVPRWRQVFLNSERAIAMSVYVIRAFVEIRERLAANAVILKRLAEIDKTLVLHGTALSDIYQKLLPLLSPPPDQPRRQIGFTR